MVRTYVGISLRTVASPIQFSLGSEMGMLAEHSGPNGLWPKELLGEVAVLVADHKEGIKSTYRFEGAKKNIIQLLRSVFKAANST
mmetsp:Transcript_32168/g.68880  ORF Transcript_32168/g.68880 Transcript_32168/m.68880 type:complete len:85 (+) Transcript_32168:374-628(+)